MMARKPTPQKPRISLATRDMIGESALDAAVAECKAASLRTFSLTWEDERKITVRAYPHTRGVIAGMAERLLGLLDKLLP